jgi:hypothetical protein
VTAYLLHAPISQQRMHYDPSSGTVRYQTAAQPPAWPYSVHETNLESEPTFTALDWLAALTSHIPNKEIPSTLPSGAPSEPSLLGPAAPNRPILLDFPPLAGISWLP